MPELPVVAREHLATLRDVPAAESQSKPPRPMRDRLPRCADCRKQRDVVRYGLVWVCRECAAARDRKHGLAVAGREWA